MHSISGVNKVILLGRISKEPRWHSESGKRWLHIVLVTTEIIRRRSDQFVHEEIHQLRIAESCSDLIALTLIKGENIIVQGASRTRSFVDEFQIRRYKTDIEI